ncbi:MAG: YncE family protein [Candidatus Koribacter versatilis]|uniref:YncE family protein n=1 Tax=Candidatus Korobacter versatilis TaxID=658062 RepID=A0A932AAK3_9BACT|nr:YncE family protein [Candidatus Koribacter versatilis]
MRRRSTGSTAIILLTLFAIGCGQTYRPVATAIPEPGGDPNNLRHAIVVNQNPGAALPACVAGPCQGSATSVDTTGDTNVGNVVAGVGPVHAGFVTSLRTYVANRGDNSVTRFLTSSPFTSPVTIAMPAGCSPDFVASRNTGTAYVACPGINRIAVLNAALDSIVTTATVGSNPRRLTESLNGNKVFALNYNGGSVSVMSTLDNVVTNTVAVGGNPVWSDLNQDGSLLFVTNEAGYVSVIDTVTEALAATPTPVPVNQITLTGASVPGFTTFDPTKRRLYVVDSPGGKVFVIDAVSTSPNFMTVIATIPVGSNPTSITALRNGAKAYVSNCGSNSVSVIDTTSLTVVNTIPTGTCPIWLTSPTDSSRVIVGVQGSGVTTDPNGIVTAGGLNFADPPRILTINTQTDSVLVMLKPPQQNPTCDPVAAANNYCALQVPTFVTMAP